MCKDFGEFVDWSRFTTDLNGIHNPPLSQHLHWSFDCVLLQSMQWLVFAT